MTAKPLPPTRPPGAIDLLAPTDDHPSDPAWRADALGMSRHSRLADELRAPIDDPDPDRAAIVCARITREVLGDYSPALLLLSPPRRRRAQALTAWTATLFDLALRPGLAGLDGDRLAQINAWEFQTEDALAGGSPTQPIFVAMARARSEQAWPCEALDGIVAAARSLAIGRGSSSLKGRTRAPAADAPALGGEAFARALLEALFGEGASDAAAACSGLVARAVALEGSAGSGEIAGAIEAPSAGRQAPPGWRGALEYARRVARHKERRAADQTASPLGLATRLRYLLGAWLLR